MGGMKPIYFLICGWMNRSKDESYMELPILYYRGYHARGERKELEVSSGENNRLKILLPAGHNGRIKVAFEEPVYWRCAEFISLLFWIGLAADVVFGWSKRIKFKIQLTKSSLLNMLIM